MNTALCLRARVQPRAERGFILLLVLSMAFGVAAFGLFAQAAVEQRWRAQAYRASASALAAARNALLGYAISYLERHPEQDYAYLPCPDRGNSGSSSLGACAARDLPASGRLPWRSLALSSPTGAGLHCLWYAVAGSVKHNPKPLSLNWDSSGQFSLRQANNIQLALPAADQRAVALIIAPGRPLAGQQRVAASPCTGDRSADLAWSDFVDSQLSPDGDQGWQLEHGLPDSPDNNDIVSWLSIDDIFAALRRRTDFVRHLNHIIDSAAASLTLRLAEPEFIEQHSQPATNPVLRHGLLPPANLLGIEANAALAHNNWRDQFRFALCADASPCIALHALSGELRQHCRAVLLFGGERVRHGSGRQQRLSAAERADPAQYFEGDNAGNLLIGIPRFSGAESFTVVDPQQAATEDVIRCLP